MYITFIESGEESGEDDDDSGEEEDEDDEDEDESSSGSGNNSDTESASESSEPSTPVQVSFYRVSYHLYFMIVENKHFRIYISFNKLMYPCLRVF